MTMAAARTPSTAARSRREKVVIVTRKTTLEELVTRFNTAGQAKFYLEHAGGNFTPIDAAHQRYHAALDGVRGLIPAGIRHQVIDRTFLPQFSFGEADLVVTVGPDGLVVNTAKYLDGQPILAVNPDPDEIEGVLLPFSSRDVREALVAAVYGTPHLQQITMAEAVLNDGQRLLAFNDLFIGVRSHISARYQITHRERSEEHSSSGILVSTGAGSTGWLRSVYAGAVRIVEGFGAKITPPPQGGRFGWDEDKLVYAVREPWPSKTTGSNLVYGVITKDSPLIVASHMTENGVIFSDGIEADYLTFTSGLTATVAIAGKRASLVVPAEHRRG
jgi:NAD kinase